MKNAIYSYIEKCPPALELFKRLEDAGAIYLIGGVLREFRDCGQIRNLRDIDIVVDVKNAELWNEILRDYAFKSNRFGGNKLMCQDLLVDTWAIEETWAFRNHVVECDTCDYVKYLPSTVFLNIDSIIYDWRNEIWYDKIYQGAMESRILDVVLPDNPQLLLNIVRSFVLKDRYGMQFSKLLQEIILEEYKKSKNISEFVSTLYQEQIRRYGKSYLSQREILREVGRIISHIEDENSGQTVF